jgi:NAD+ synthase
MKLSIEIVEWIKAKINEAKAKGAVFGMSGGIDSSVIASLAKKAAGDNALGLILPCHSSSLDKEYAHKFASRIGIKTLCIPLDSIYDNLLEILSPGNDLVRGNLKSRLRMNVLYYFANMLNYIVIGTGNKSEIAVGYFTKYGDGSADILPLGGLLKAEVRELAMELDIPEEIIKREPSAGLWEGQTDEGEFGFSYEELDSCLRALDCGKYEGISSEILAKVKRLIKNSEHKRAPVPIFKKGGLRVKG